MRFIISFFSLIFFLNSCTTNHEVDLIVYNAKVYTVDTSFYIAEAFAIRAGVFVEIGRSQDILKRYKAKEMIDAEGKPVFPGFYDAHTHFRLFAESLGVVDLSSAASFDELIQMLVAYEKQHPDRKWIVGRGWDQNKWDNSDFPTKDTLDKYFPDIPVLLSRVDYHAALVNSKAIQITNLSVESEIEGGIVVVDSLDKPTGVLIDNAVHLVRQHIPGLSDDEVLSFYHQAQDSLFSVGLTTIVDAGLNERELEELKNLYVDRKLKIRNYAMIADKAKVVKKWVRAGEYDDGRLNIRSVKLMADGALGSRGACLLEPYSDDTTNFGIMLNTSSEFEAMIKELASSSFQVSTHAIGDSANRYVLDMYGKYLTDNKNRRWRIEHAQVINESDFEKFGRFKIIPSIQPTHATSDMYWAESRLGPDRVRMAYAYKRLRDVADIVAIGSDFPVEHFNPLYGFHAAVARKDKNGYPEGGFLMTNALTRTEALLGMTIWAAYACFQEAKRGNIERGKDADFVILDQDIMTIPEDKIRSTKVLRTVIAGETVFQRS